MSSLVPPRGSGKRLARRIPTPNPKQVLGKRGSPRRAKPRLKGPVEGLPLYHLRSSSAQESTGSLLGCLPVRLGRVLETQGISLLQNRAKLVSSGWSNPGNLFQSGLLATGNGTFTTSSKWALNICPSQNPLRRRTLTHPSRPCRNSTSPRLSDFLRAFL